MVPRRSTGYKSERTAGAAGPYAASPFPTTTRVRNNARKVVANPDAPLARLHTATPTAISFHRGQWSASLPKIGAVSMNEKRKAGMSRPMRKFTLSHGKRG